MRLQLHIFNVVFLPVVSLCEIKKCIAGRNSHFPSDDIDSTGSDVEVRLPEWCFNPSGSNCRWYRDCLAVTLFFFHLYLIEIQIVRETTDVRQEVTSQSYFDNLFLFALCSDFNCLRQFNTRCYNLY